MGKIKTPRQRAVDKLDKVFSQYIRLSASFMGQAVCVTCGKQDEWKKLQNGHYFSRGKFGTRWDTRNCHVQCYRCNVLLKGNYPKYAAYMYRKYGDKEMELLELRSNTSPRFTVSELELMIVEVEKKLLDLTIIK